MYLNFLKSGMGGGGGGEQQFYYVKHVLPINALHVSNTVISFS